MHCWVTIRGLSSFTHRIWNHSLLLTHTGCVVITSWPKSGYPSGLYQVLSGLWRQSSFIHLLLSFFIINTIRFLTFNFGEMCLDVICQKLGLRAFICYEVFGTRDEAQSPSFWHVFSNETIRIVWSQMKNMFHLRWKPGGVSSGVSLGINIHPRTWPKWRSFIGFWLHELLMSLRTFFPSCLH